MAAKLGLVLDCANPDTLAEFWSQAIGYTTLGGAGSYVMLVDETGQQPKLLLQRVEEPKAGKNRMHVDIETPHVDRPRARPTGGRMGFIQIIEYTTFRNLEVLREAVL